MASLPRRVGDLALPLEASSVVSGTFPDPARDQLLELFAAAINAELAAAWPAGAVGTPLELTAPVQSKLPLEPTPNVMLEQKQAFPLLALHRTGAADYEELTLQIEQRRQQWQLHYFLSPLRVDHVRRLSGVLTWVPTIVQQVIYMQGHPAYEGGALQFGTGKGGLATLRIINHELGQARFADTGDDGPTYLACSITLETTELGGWTDAASVDLDGATFKADVGDATNLLVNMIEAETEYPLVYG
jgi:hypothetical protein